ARTASRRNRASGSVAAMPRERPQLPATSDSTTAAIASRISSRLVLPAAASPTFWVMPCSTSRAIISTGSFATGTSTCAVILSAPRPEPRTTLIESGSSIVNLAICLLHDFKKRFRMNRLIGAASASRRLGESHAKDDELLVDPVPNFEFVAGPAPLCCVVPHSVKDAMHFSRGDHPTNFGIQIRAREPFAFRHVHLPHCQRTGRRSDRGGSMARSHTVVNPVARLRVGDAHAPPASLSYLAALASHCAACSWSPRSR